MCNWFSWQRNCWDGRSNFDVSKNVAMAFSPDEQGNDAAAAAVVVVVGYSCEGMYF